jgi:inhibitor of cysteine peptidase
MMSKVSKLALLSAMMLFIVALAAGCGRSEEIALDADDNGRQIEAKKGQVLAVTLESNPTTGYQWEWVPSQEDVLQQVGEAEFQPRSDLVGAPGTQTLRFKAVKAGQTTLELVYRRSWEKDVEPLEAFTAQVVVR